MKWAPLLLLVYKTVVFEESCKICGVGNVSVGPRNSDDSSTVEKISNKLPTNTSLVGRKRIKNTMR